MMNKRRNGDFSFIFGLYLVFVERWGKFTALSKKQKNKKTNYALVYCFCILSLVI